MARNRKYLRIFLGLFSVVFLFLFKDSDIDYKNRLWDIHIDAKLLDTDFAKDFTSQIPVIYIETEDSDILVNPDPEVYPRRGETQSSIYVYYLNKVDGENSLYTIPDQVFENNRVKIRGRSSSLMPKIPYAIELQDENGLPVNRQFISLEKESDFVLHAPYIDKSGIKNYFTYTLAAQMLDYVPDAQPVEVIINTEGTDVTEKDYRGIYLAVEKIKTGKNRVPIKSFVLKNSLEEQLQSGGGYIFRRDKFDENTDTALLLPQTPMYYDYQVCYPKAEELTQEAADMIYQEICFYEDILYNGTFEQLDKYFDVDSFIDIILLNELSYHSESFTGSTYFYRLPGGKLCRGPPWDYDIAYTSQVNYENIEGNTMYRKSRLERVFLHQPEFLERLKQRWAEYRSEGGIFSDEYLLKLADYCINTIGEDAFERNATKYPELFDGETYVPGNGQKCTSWQEELQFFKDFLVARGEYLDGVFAELTCETLPEKE